MKRLLVLALLGAPSVSGCGARRAAAPPGPSATAGDRGCLLHSAGGDAPDTVVVGAAGTVTPERAPGGISAAERLVFLQLYETLVNLDCQDRLRPGLASAWAAGDHGRAVTFTLREGARFWDGRPVTAGDVATGWGARPWADSVTSPNPGTVVAWLSRPEPDAARRFADPALAVTRAGGQPRWAGKMGTGPLRPVDRSRGRLVAASPDGGSVLVFRFASEVDLRDLLDQGADLVLADDPAVLEYARSRGAFELIPLPWNRTYVIGSAPELRAELAGLASQVRPGAVRGEVRPPQGSFWWSGADTCDDTVPAAGGAGGPVARRIVYPSGDRIAQDLAARLVALTGGGGNSAPAQSPLRAAALSAEAFAASLVARSEWGYVTAVSHHVWSGCVPSLLQGAVALAEARSTLIVRPGRMSLTLTGLGLPRLNLP
ncbi:MAG TPA: ABC transporter substrate-binding protein [Gemmatimonadales bacterium]|nr:ABC transporter substrate-binding protein [Gemmatimonadales bacterium]